MASGSSYVNIFGGSVIKPAQPSYLALTIATSTDLVWPLETTEGSPEAAAQLDVTATFALLSLAMPPGNTGSLGVATMITNVGANTFTVTDQSGNQITQIATTQSWIITLTDNSTANGTWRAYQLASTTSSATAGSLAGPGLVAAGSLLETNWLTSLLSVNTTLTTAYRSKAINWTGVTGTFQLDAKATLTAGWYCAISNVGTGALTVSTTGGDTINGQATLTMQPGNSGIIVCAAGGFTSYGALIGPLSILNGGTGASTAPQALTNLGGTTIGKSIFTAANAAAVVSLLGLQNLPLIETTVATNQVASSSSSATAYVCTAALGITLPLTTTLTTKFQIFVYAQGGAVTLTPQTLDQIDGGVAAATYLIPKGAAVMLTTDANGNWWPFFNQKIASLSPASSPAITVPVSGPIDVFVDCSLVAVAVTIPPTGGPYTIIDSTGNAGTNHITVALSSGMINGQPTLALNSNYQPATIATNGTNGFITA